MTPTPLYNSTTFPVKRSPVKISGKTNISTLFLLEYC